MPPGSTTKASERSNITILRSCIEVTTTVSTSSNGCSRPRRNSGMTPSTRPPASWAPRAARAHRPHAAAAIDQLEPGPGEVARRSGTPPRGRPGRRRSTSRNRRRRPWRRLRPVSRRRLGRWTGSRHRRPLQENKQRAAHLWAQVMEPRFGAPAHEHPRKQAAGASPAVGYDMIRIREIGFKSAAFRSARPGRFEASRPWPLLALGGARAARPATRSGGEQGRAVFGPGRLSETAAGDVGDPPGRRGAVGARPRPLASVRLGAPTGEALVGKGRHGRRQLAAGDGAAWPRSPVSMACR